jgi:hypothetical protein
VKDEVKFQVRLIINILSIYNLRKTLSLVSGKCEGVMQSSSEQRWCFIIYHKDLHGIYG